MELSRRFLGPSARFKIVFGWILMILKGFEWFWWLRALLATTNQKLFDRRDLSPGRVDGKQCSVCVLYESCQSWRNAFRNSSARDDLQVLSSFCEKFEEIHSKFSWLSSTFTRSPYHRFEGLVIVLDRTQVRAFGGAYAWFGGLMQPRAEL